MYGPKLIGWQSCSIRALLQANGCWLWHRHSVNILCPSWCKMGTLLDGEPILKLPPNTIRLSKVDFSTEERAFYTNLEVDSRSRFKAYAAIGIVNQNYANILLMLLLLRQACDQPFLVKDYNSESVGKVSVEMAKRVPSYMLINLLDCLETSFAICRVCYCVSEYLTGDDNTFPAHACKEQLGSDVVFSKATLSSCLSADVGGSSMNSQLIENSMILRNEFSSSKIRAVLEILGTNCKMCSYMERNGSSLTSEKAYAENCTGFSATKHTIVYSETPVEGPIKTIIFSQWTSMLDLAEMSSNESCIHRAVKDFNTDPEVTVMLMSLNLGLNMVAACHVVLLDLWWNPTTEDQAVD